MKKILITGGAGFIGSNFIEHILNNQEVIIYNLDKLTYAGNLDNLKSVENHERYHFIKGDICNRVLIEEIFAESRNAAVIHFAAASHVDHPIQNPTTLIQTNIIGSFH